MATLDRLAPPRGATAPASTWPRRAIAAAVLLATVMALFQVAHSSGLAHTGQTLLRLDRERRDTQAQVHQLEAEIAILSSLDRIEQGAKGRLGMAPANGTLYIQVDQAAPDAPLVPRPLVGIRQNQEKESASLWQPILKALRLF